MIKSKFSILLCCLIILWPGKVFALSMPQNGNDLANMEGLYATAYVVSNADTGEVLISKNPDKAWPPASLTKLVTALVVLDTKPKMSKMVSMTLADQTVGVCGQGGACIKSKAGIKFTVDGLFHAMLMPSANNAANALARNTGLSPEAFAQKMNEKAAALGAVGSHFNEPTGLDPQNIITAADYAKIISAALSNSYLKRIAAQGSFLLRSSNNTRYNQTIKNTDKLLSDRDIVVIGAKTGYIDESLYNFSALIQTKQGKKLAVVVLGEKHLYSAFAETKLLARLGDVAQSLVALNLAPKVLSEISIKN